MLTCNCLLMSSTFLPSHVTRAITLLYGVAPLFHSTKAELLAGLLLRLVVGLPPFRMSTGTGLLSTGGYCYYTMRCLGVFCRKELHGFFWNRPCVCVLPSDAKSHGIFRLICFSLFTGEYIQDFG